MYAVIFRASVATVGPEYHQTAERMRCLAIEKYGCVEFISVTEGDQEISISYWKSEAQINQWKSDPEHLVAQELGRTKWYDAYSVQVTQVVREYQQTNLDLTKS